jgi:hypothetical protein
MWRYHFIFFLILFLFSFPKRQQNEVLSRNSNGRTEGTDPESCIGAWSGRTSGGQGCSQFFFLLTCGNWTGTGRGPQKKKKEEGGAKFKCNYSGHGKPPRQVFDDKYLELMKQNWWGGGGKKLPNTWSDREEAYNDLMQIMGKKVQCQLLGRCITRQEDGWSRWGGGGGNGIEQCDGAGEGGGGAGGDGDDDSMDDDEHDNEVLEENRSGPEEEEEEDQEDPLPQDHVEVTALLHLLNRSVTPPLPPDSDWYSVWLIWEINFWLAFCDLKFVGFHVFQLSISIYANRTLTSVIHLTP